MELSVTEKARAIYLAVKDVPGISATVNSRYQELALELLAGKDRMELTSFSVNGQSFTGEIGITRYELLQLLGIVKWQIDNTATISTRRTGVYFN